jgi:hypothetical protein
LDEGSGVWSREDGVNHSLSQTDIVTPAQLSMLLEGIDWLVTVILRFSSNPAVKPHGQQTGPNSFHEKAGRGQDTLRFFLSVSLFPFS